MWRIAIALQNNIRYTQAGDSADQPIHQYT